MQEAAVDFLRRVRSILEAAADGRLTDDDLSAGRNAMNALLELDWVMPRIVSEVSIRWKTIEDALRSGREAKVGERPTADEMQPAWTAYRDLEDVFRDRPS